MSMVARQVLRSFCQLLAVVCFGHSELVELYDLSILDDSNKLYLSLFDYPYSFDSGWKWWQQSQASVNP